MLRLALAQTPLQTQSSPTLHHRWCRACRVLPLGILFTQSKNRQCPRLFELPCTRCNRAKVVKAHLTQGKSRKVKAAPRQLSESSFILRKNCHCCAFVSISAHFPATLSATKPTLAWLPKTACVCPVDHPRTTLLSQA